MNVIITGSSRGIGLCAAEAFFAAGYNVMMNCVKNEELIRRAAASLNGVARGNKAGFFTADVSDYDACRAMVGYAVNEHGAPDVLINNAGIAAAGLFTDMTPDIYRRAVEVNLISAMHMSHLVLPHMLKRRSGCIINISSFQGGRGASCEAVYAASKAGLEGFTKSLAKEYGPSGIRVNAIAPGIVDTDMNSRLTPEEKADLVYQIGLDRFADPREIADIALFLAGDTASYINGAVISADGGI